MKMQRIVARFYLGLINLPWIGLDCLDVGTYGAQNACTFCMRKRDM
jgi:hypothetical protein